MNSKERVLTTFSHRTPDRVPRWCGSSPEFWNKSKKALNLDDEGLRIRFGDDFRRITAPYLDQNGREVAPFGIERGGVGYGMALSHPLANASIGEMKEYPWPDPNRVDLSFLHPKVSVETDNYETDNYPSLHRPTQDWFDHYAILGGDWSPFWHDVIDMVGMENLFIRMYTEPEWAHAIYDLVFDYYYAVNERIFSEVGDLIDIFFIGNDMGSNNGALIGTDLFAEYLQPKFRKMADLGHAYKSKVLLHCCGGFRELMPQIIESGIDGVHAIQPSCYGMELKGLKKDFGDKLLFNGCIDSQFVVIEGTPDYVRQETRKTLETMMPGGGFVAGASHDFLLEETPLENVLAMFDTVQEFGHYL
jgi:uroporphyrinogen-III decarboxylase